MRLNPSSALRRDSEPQGDLAILGSIWAPLLALTLLATACGDSAAHHQARPDAAAPVAPATTDITQVAPGLAKGSLIVLCGGLFEGTGEQLRESVAVVIRDGKIAEVLPQTAPELQQLRLPVLDLNEFTVLPGLIDLHTHLTDSPEDTADLAALITRTATQTPTQQLEVARRNALITLQAGFTSVRNVGTYLAWSSRSLRDEINHGQTPGPRMQVAGFYLTIPGGGGDLLPPGIPESSIPNNLRQGVARGAAQFADKAREAVAGGADVIKVIASGAVLAFGSKPGAPEMTPEELRAVVEVAHAAGIKVAAHAHGAQSIEDAILAGADTIEHASLIDEARLLLAREHHVPLVMDVYNGDYIDSEGRRQGWPAEFLEKNLATVEEQRHAFRRAVELGVPIAFGTDSAVYPHGDNAKQLAVMVKHGMTPVQALRSATVDAARAMGWQDRVGEARPGFFGDLIAVHGDPLADITVVEHVAVVVLGGTVVSDRRGHENVHE